MPARIAHAEVLGQLDDSAIRHGCISLSMVENDIGIVMPLGSDAEDRQRTTVRWWENWSGSCKYAGPYHEEAVRSAITLKLLSFSLSRAVIATATTSLPETVGGGRNWNYRYCWLRDASLTLEAFLSLGHAEEASAFLEWLLHATLGKMIEEECLDRERGYRAARESGAPDASLLLLPRYRYLAGDEPRMLRTFETIEQELGVGDGLLLRYPHGFDGMAGAEHPFAICGFWAIEALARQGRVEEAERRLDVMLGFASDVGLYAEEISADTGEAIGNFPQAFTHIGLINAAQAIEIAKRSREQQEAD